MHKVAWARVSGRMNAISDRSRDHWRARLSVPAYRIGDAARYAETSVQTVARWIHPAGTGPLTARLPGSELSYLQLIEVAIVAAMRKSGVKLSEIRKAHNYMVENFKEPFPFAKYKFKTDGRNLILGPGDLKFGEKLKNLMLINQSGQYAWNEIIGDRLASFEYINNDVVISWRVGGKNSPVVIDPRIAFGAPHINGVATWAIKGRLHAGEAISEIAEDFGISEEQVIVALEFEKIEKDSIH